MEEIKKGDRFFCIADAYGDTISRGPYDLYKFGKIYEAPQDGHILTEESYGSQDWHINGFPWQKWNEEFNVIGYEKILVKIKKDMELNIKVKDGWQLNPNYAIINGILRRCAKNDGLCPCVHDDEDYDGRDLHCPCTDYLLKDKCCCGLYVKKDEE